MNIQEYLDNLRRFAINFGEFAEILFCSWRVWSRGVRLASFRRSLWTMPGIWMVYVWIEKRHLSFYSDTVLEYVLEKCQIYLTYGVGRTQRHYPTRSCLPRTRRSHGRWRHALIIYLLRIERMFYVGEYRMLVQLPRNLETPFQWVNDRKVEGEKFMTEKPRRYWLLEILFF